MECLALGLMRTLPPSTAPVASKVLVDDAKPHSCDYEPVVD